MLDSVLDIIKRTKKGVTVAQLKEKTQLNARQLSNALYKLTKKGKIQTKSRGLYVKK
jgi:predicted Rossmann fold nucleotide-binding protein DprA/Smf involved in DNA uptake